MQVDVLENAKTGATRTEKILKVALFVFIATTIVLSGILALAGKNIIKLHSEEYCVTAECTEAAVFMFNNINWSADPCNNFFEFACGKWLKENSIPDEYSSYGTYKMISKSVKIMLKELLQKPVAEGEEVEAIQKAKLLYQSCMNETAIEMNDMKPLLEILKDPALRWPVLETYNGPEGTWKEQEFSLLETLAVLRGQYNNNILFTFSVEVDSKNSEDHILTLDQGSLFMESREDYLTNSTETKTYRDALLKLMIDMAILLGANSTTAHADMAKVLEFEIELAKIVIPNRNRTSETLYNKFTILQLQNTIPGFDWLHYMNMVIDDEFNPELKHINVSEDIIVYVPQYLKDLVKLLQTVDNRTVANYVVWRIVYRRTNNLSKRFLNRRLEYLKVVRGMTSLAERWIMCVVYVDYIFSYAVGRMFVDAHFQEDKKKLTEELVEGVRWAFLDILDKENDWMDKDTKNKAKEKANGVHSKIGYPSFILNDTIITESYRNITISSSNYFENVVLALLVFAQADFAWLRLHASKTGWFTSPTTVNAFYSPTQNQIQFPAGELQKPFFWGEQYPLSISYGGIGTIVGHEFSHAFDNNGRKYDKFGNLQQWWTNASISKFEEKTQCMIKQYDDYYWLTAGMHVNGKMTLGENIADNAGIRQSFRAYRKWIREKRGGKEEDLLPGIGLSNNQLFFLSYANVRCDNYRPEAARIQILNGVHSPSEFRTIGAMSNFEEFSKAFNCPETSVMNRGSNACRVW
ncbi:phosphate-regulating neutral endopeptidase PHEX [Callorhinchus milii]|uniref:phosphate-regulating neutral endopeptidase PHEX n=1 Tax=Callorhinchus milii TaxID=7868 RepID=UPI001C3FD87D|nr:phosphate-regulating neutral endopeptidase PHEX [Callorhinchus milii]